MPEERFGRIKQTQQRRQPDWTLPSWLWRPEMIAERYRTGWQPPTPAPIPMDLAMAQAGEAQARGVEEFRERGGFENIEKRNLISQINWYLGFITPRVPIDTDTASIEELQSYLESLERADAAQVGWGVGAQGGQLPERGQRAGEIRLRKEEQAERAERVKLESRVLAREFPEWFKAHTGQITTAPGRAQTIAQSQARQAAYGAIAPAQAVVGAWRQTAYQARLAYEAAVTPEQKRAAGYTAAGRMLAGAEKTKAGAVKAWKQAGVGGKAPPPPPEETFGAWFKKQPEYEKIMRGWEVRQYTDYPQLYPWYKEAGGWGTEKTFEEWKVEEPLAQAYLTALGQQPLPKTRKQWQPARQRA